MTPTADLRTELRELLDEEIPAGGSESDTRFIDAQLDRLLTNAENVYLAAADGWTRKAGMLQRELGQLAETQAGDERVTRVNLSTAVNYCLTMAKQYRETGQGQSSDHGSRVLGFEAPDVLGTESEEAKDLARLLGYDV